MRTLLYGIVGVGVALAFMLGLGGCGSVSAQPLVLGEAGAPKDDSGAGAGDVVGREEVAAAMESQDGAAGATGGSDAVDAMPADANGGDGVNAEVAQEAPAREVAAPDIISGDWPFSFVNMTHGEMTLTLSGNVVTGTFYLTGAGVPGGIGAIRGTFDGETLALAFTGPIEGSAMGPVAMQADGTWLVNNVPATLNGKPAQFWAKH